MPRDVQPVTITHEEGPTGNVEVHSHPAFGQISISRSSGGGGVLYGSDFQHHSRITVRIKPSTTRRHLSSDWHHSSHRGEIVEFDMSESQWATLIATMNMGEGVPCTLRYIDGRLIPDIAERVNRTDQFGAEMVKQFEKSLDRLRDLHDKIDGMSLGKAKTAAIKQELSIAISHLGANTKFVAESFDEHMEETVERGKAEIAGYMNATVQHAGLTSLRGVASPIALAGPTEETE